jgi:hypothetical protein
MELLGEYRFWETTPEVLLTSSKRADNSKTFRHTIGFRPVSFLSKTNTIFSCARLLTFYIT